MVLSITPKNVAELWLYTKDGVQYTLVRGCNLLKTNDVFLTLELFYIAKNRHKSVLDYNSKL